MSTFKEKVFAVVRKIPKGKTMTYKEVAIRIGSPNSFRAVGTALKSNFDQAIPCHRVIRSGGELGQYNRGESQKRLLLMKEGAIKQ